MTKLRITDVKRERAGRLFLSSSRETSFFDIREASSDLEQGDEDGH